MSESSADVVHGSGNVPRIIQGGMGVAISGWQLAAAVAATGQLGVVSGTALEVVCARRLQAGDPGGHVRRALAAFGVASGAPAVADWILAAYFVEEGAPTTDMYRVTTGSVDVRSDWRASPTGFPFRVVDLPETLTDPGVRALRRPVCDLGVLRSAYVTPSGAVDYRCPAEPQATYVDRKGGRAATMQGRVCLCNALMASAGMPQRRRGGYVEPPLVTAGSDFSTVAQLLRELPDGRTYSASDVVAHVLEGSR